MKKITAPFMPLLLSFLIVGCGRSTAGDASPRKPSLGEALEASLSQSPTEQKARSAAKEQQRKFEASQQKLQQDRLKSYSDTRAFGQN